MVAISKAANALLELGCTIVSLKIQCLGGGIIFEIFPQDLQTSISLQTQHIKIRQELLDNLIIADTF